MACEGCEQRRQKLKALINDSAKSISNAIARLTNRDRKAEQPSDSTEQSIDQSGGSTEQPDQRIIVNARRTRRSK